MSTTKQTKEEKITFRTTGDVKRFLDRLSEGRRRTVSEVVHAAMEVVMQNPELLRGKV